MRQAPEMPWHRHQAEAHQHRQHEETPGVRRSDAPALEISLDLPTGDQNQQQNHQDEAVDAIEDLRILEGKQAEIRGAWFLLCTLQNCSYKLDLSWSVNVIALGVVWIIIIIIMIMIMIMSGVCLCIDLDVGQHMLLAILAR